MLFLILILWTSDPTDVEAAGRLDYVVSRCGLFGWKADDEERLARLERLIAQENARSREDVIQEFRRGVRYAFSREGEALEETTTSAGRLRWATETEARCDRVARDHPSLLSRIPDTATRWARLLDDQVN